MVANYLPANLPPNRGLWPQEYREKERLDLRANQLITQMYEEEEEERREIKRRKIVAEIDLLPAENREFFKERLNHWREHGSARKET